MASAPRRSDYNRNSRYVQGGTSESLETRIGWWERQNFQTDVTDETLLITSRWAKRPDLMAYDLYGRPFFQWFILQYNSIVDINIEFVEGRTVRVPTLARLQTLLAKRAR